MKAAIGTSTPAQPSGRTAVTHSKEFADLIKCIGECRSKQEEDRIMMQEVTALKKIFASPNLDKTKTREYLLRLVYVEMLGNDAAFAYINVVNACGEKNWVMKKLGYLATTLFLNEDSEYIIMLVNTIMKDLRDDNPLVVCTALHAVCRLINNDTIEGYMPLVVNLLKHPKDLVKKKAVMAVHRFLQIRPSLREDLDKHLRTALCDKDPSVMGASLCALHEVIKQKPEAYKNLTASFVSILKQVVEHRLPKTYDYHKTPAPFIQIKILKILAELGRDDKKSSENMYTVLADVMRRGNTGHTIGNAVVYECVRVITAIHPNTALLQSAAEMVGTFLRSSSHNLKYIGIDSLAAIVAVNPQYVLEQQMAIIDCLEDPDDSLKRQTLQLLYKMTNSSNVEVIVERMLNYLGQTTDPHSKSETSSRIAELAEKYAPDNVWFIEVMTDVFKLGGDAVNAKLGTNIMRIIADAYTPDDPQPGIEMRTSAVESYLQILDMPKISELLLQVIIWVLGEYGAAYCPQGAGGVIPKLVGVLNGHAISDSTRGYLLAALGKICCQTGSSLSKEAEAFVRSAASSRNADVQQRALEIQALWSSDRLTQTVALPKDAACEDPEIDVNLPFLDKFVATALEAGATPFIPKDQRMKADMDEINAAAASAGNMGLRFEAYQLTTAESFATGTSLGATPGLAGPLDSSMSPSSAPALRSSGPQLNISGPRKWGPASYNAAPTPSTPPPDVPVIAVSAAPTTTTESVATTASYAEPPSERAKLASMLFGGGGSSTGRGVGRRGASSRPPSQAPAPPAIIPDLLDFDIPVKAQPEAAAATSSPMDPFAALGDLSINAAPSISMATAAPGASPSDLFMGLNSRPVVPTPASVPPVMPQMASATGPLFGGMSMGVSPQQQPMPMPQMMGGMQPMVLGMQPMGGMQPMVLGMQPMGGMQTGMMMMGGGMQMSGMPLRQMQMPMGGQPRTGATTASRPKLGEKPKDDPFADLLS